MGHHWQGYCLSPPSVSHENYDVWTNKIITRELTSTDECARPRYGATFALKSCVKEVFNPAQVNEMFELDFQERCGVKNERSLSIEDQKFLNILGQGIHMREDRHYEMPLPQCSEEVELPNNCSLALKRLFLLKEHFKRDPGYYKDYVKFMEGVLRDCAERCEGDVASMGRVNYVPHHSIYHPKKPGKIRVVFDCSARYARTSLNQNLLQGPDLTNSLVGVLCRFHQEAIAFSCDVESVSSILRE